MKVVDIEQKLKAFAINNYRQAKLIVISPYDMEFFMVDYEKQYKTSPEQYRILGALVLSSVQVSIGSAEIA